MIPQFNKPKNKNNTGKGGYRPGTISGQVKVLLLLLFCIAAAATVFYGATRSFSRKQKVPPSATGVQAPAIMLDNVRKAERAIRITDEEYIRIQSFKQHMETISNTPSGRRMFDSILIARPGLLDSIIIIEELYQTQAK